MNKCPDCGIKMKPLVFSFFCPNDCDKKKEDKRISFKVLEGRGPNEILVYSDDMGMLAIHPNGVFRYDWCMSKIKHKGLTAYAVPLSGFCAEDEKTITFCKGTPFRRL